MSEFRLLKCKLCQKMLPFGPMCNRRGWLVGLRLLGVGGFKPYRRACCTMSTVRTHERYSLVRRKKKAEWTYTHILELEQRSTSLPPVKGKHLVAEHPPPAAAPPSPPGELAATRCSRFPVRSLQSPPTWLFAAKNGKMLWSLRRMGATIYEFYGQECRFDELEVG